MTVYLRGMNAAEIIEMIKRLSPEDQAEVMTFLRRREELGAAAGRVKETAIDPMTDVLAQAEAERRATRIFRENHELFDAWRNERQRSASFSFVGDGYLVTSRVIATARGA